jgi:uridine phosphorylase
VVAPFLQRHGVRALAAILVSHVHADHLGGVPSLLRRFGVGILIEPGAPVPDPAYGSLLAALDSARIPWHPGRAGERFTLDGVRFTLLHPPPDFPYLKNDSSCVLRIDTAAADALLPGDPGRALAMAQALLTKPLMSNHHRGLWGYSGKTRSGTPLTIQSTGIGGPSAAIVLSELAELGVRRAIRVGTCGALAPALELSELLSAEAAIGADGVSARLNGGGNPLRADPALRDAIAETGMARQVTVLSTDLFYGAEAAPAPPAPGAAAVEMEAAALFALGPRLGVSTACLLVVSDVFERGRRRRIDDDALAAAVERMGAAAVAALEGAGQVSSESRASAGAG